MDPTRDQPTPSTDPAVRRTVTNQSHQLAKPRARAGVRCVVAEQRFDFTAMRAGEIAIDT